MNDTPKRSLWWPSPEEVIEICQAIEGVEERHFAFLRERLEAVQRELGLINQELADMPARSIEDASSAKRELERAILSLIQAYEEKYECQVVVLEIESEHDDDDLPPRQTTGVFITASGTFDF